MRATVARMIELAALLCVGVHARQPAPVTDLKVAAHLAWKVNPPPGYDMGAKFHASRLLAEAGIQLEWLPRIPDAAVVPDVIGIIVVATAPPEYAAPGKIQALASALPYGRGPVHIQVYFDRLTDYVAPYGARGPMIMGHVLAHEIGHVVEGIARHSATGLMRATWSTDDLLQIERQTLSFAPEDRLLMRSRLASKEDSVPVLSGNLANAASYDKVRDRITAGQR